MRSKLAVFFKVIAWILFIGGLIAGFALGRTPTLSSSYSVSTKFSFITALVIWLTSGFSGISCLAFASVLDGIEEILDSMPTSGQIQTLISKSNFSSRTSSNSNTAHSWQCPSCGRQVSSYPCLYCGNAGNPVAPAPVESSVSGTEQSGD